MPTRSTADEFPLGAAVTLEQLDRYPYPVLAGLRAAEPVSWVPVLGGWLVTSRDGCIEVLRDAATFTVDDPRFTTAQVVGPSMLSRDGETHRRHRDPFAVALRLPHVRERYDAAVRVDARRLVDDLAPTGRADVRRDLAGPLAVQVMIRALELLDTTPDELLRWYVDIVGAVDRLSAGGAIGVDAPVALAALRERVDATVEGGVGVLAEARASLSSDEVASNAAVMLFGGIETSEGMTTSLFWHVLSDPTSIASIHADPALIPNAVEESLRLEPAAGRVDRFATEDVTLGDARIRRGDLVIVSLTGANRDPATFEDPDRFDPARREARTHLTFAQGPHACIGLHLARLEAAAALEAAVGGWPGLRLGQRAMPPTGVVFRKPRALPVDWGAAPIVAPGS
jgi:cytochrome P450